MGVPEECLLSVLLIFYSRYHCIIQPKRELERANKQQAINHFNSLNKIPISAKYNIPINCPFRGLVWGCGDKIDS